MNVVSTAAAVIPFPKRNRGRVRKTECLGAAGVAALGFFGISAPSNMIVLDDHRQEEIYAEDTTHLLAIAMFACAGDEQKASIRTQIGYLIKAAPESRKRLIARRLEWMLRK